MENSPLLVGCHVFGQAIDDEVCETPNLEFLSMLKKKYPHRKLFTFGDFCVELHNTTDCDILTEGFLEIDTVFTFPILISLGQCWYSDSISYIWNDHV